MGPPFIVIRNAVAGADQSFSRLVTALHNQKGFRSSGGWVHHDVCQEELTLNVKGKPVTSTYKRNYLRNAHSHTVITANAKAWMKTVAMVMWMELQLSRWQAGKPKVVVMDTCGPHTVPAAQQAMEEQGVTVHLLPPNTTSELQAMDLVVNAPLKSSIRRACCKEIAAEFKAWRQLHSTGRPKDSDSQEAT